MFSKDSTIGIIGLGATGDALRQHFVRHAHQVRVFDPQRGIGSLRDVNDADLLFLCMPVSSQPSRGFDGRALEDAVSLLEGPRVIVITLNVLPGTTEAFQCRYPQHCFFTNVQLGDGDVRRPERQIVGYTAQSRHLAESLLALLPDAPYSRVLPAREAELARYITSALVAMELALASEARDLCAALDADYAAVQNVLGARPSRLDADGDRAAVAAITADTNALLALAADLGVPLRLLRTASEISVSLAQESDSAAEQPLLGDGRWLQVLAPDPGTSEQAA